MQQGRSFDSGYVSELSDDAVPALIENLPTMNFEQQCTVKRKISNRFIQAEAENDFERGIGRVIRQEQRWTVQAKF